MKKPGTVAKEDHTLQKWKKHLGGLRLDKIKPVHVSAFMRKRLPAGVCKRTAKLDIIALRNVLKRARDIGDVSPCERSLIIQSFNRAKIMEPRGTRRSCDTLHATRKAIRRARHGPNVAGCCAKCAKRSWDFLLVARHRKVTIRSFRGKANHYELSIRWILMISQSP